MAINFLNTVSYNQNQLKQPVIDNQLNDTAAGTPVDGQLYYDTTLNVLKVGENSAWVTIAGSVTSVDETTPGTSTGTPIVVDPTTGAVTIKSMAFDGDSNIGHVPSSNGVTQSTNFLRADGTWAIPTGSVDTTYDFLANESSVGSNADPFLTLDPSTGTDDNVKLIGGTGINIAKNNGGTEVTFSTTADNYNKWVLRDSSDSDSDITTGKFVKFTAATGTAGVTVSGAGSTSDPYVMAIQLPNDNTQYTAGTGLTLTGTEFSANVNTTAANDDTVALAATADRFYAVQLDNNSTAADKKLVVNVPWSNTNTQNTYALDKAANSTDLTLAKNGSVQDTIEFSGVSFEVEVTGVDEDVYKFGLPDTVKITTQLEVLGNGVDSIKTAGKAQSASTAGTDVNTTLVTKDYVDGLVSGGLTFKGTFRADTGEILSGDNDGSYLYQLSGSNFNPSAARVAVALGDYYVVANTGGNFYGSGGTGTCATTSFLDVGDAVIGVEVAVADASVCSDWSLISQGVVVNSFKADSANSTYLTMTPTTATTGAVELDADLSAVDGTSTTSTRFLSKDNTWDVPSYTSAYSLPTASTTVLGGVKLFNDTDVTEADVNAVTTTSSRWYGVQLTENDRMVVNIPWTNTQNANQTISGVGSDNTDSGIELSASGGTVLVLGAGSVTAAQSGNTITLTGVNTQYTAGDGLTLSGTEFAVDYAGTDNVIEVATDLEGSAINLSDTIIYSDSDDNNVKKGLVSDLPFSAAGAFSAANVVLNTSTSGVSQQSGPPAGTEGWVIDTNSVLGATAINTKCEVITSGGETVYADVTRSGNNLTINFVGSSIAQGTYQALIIKVA
tara:strand:+ start:923 stop:3442 length:2520 start_codon:yes stop_codon:yes gene_type:complete